MPSRRCVVYLCRQILWQDPMATFARVWTARYNSCTNMVASQNHVVAVLACKKAYSAASRYSCSYSSGASMAESIFDHDRLDVYRFSIDYVASCFAFAKELNGLHRHTRDQWLRAAQSIPLNIAEGNGKRSLKDRIRSLDTARGSALECASIQDVLSATDGLNSDSYCELKRMLRRIVSMLTGMIGRADVVSESGKQYNAADEYEYREG